MMTSYIKEIGRLVNNLPHGLTVLVTKCVMYTSSAEHKTVWLLKIETSPKSWAAKVQKVSIPLNSCSHGSTSEGTRNVWFNS